MVDLLQANWYALVANAEFMLHDVQNEAFAEQLRERVRLFGEKERRQDFFLVCEPAWLDAHFPQEAQRVGRPCVALVSTDKIWITCGPRSMHDTSHPLSLPHIGVNHVWTGRSPVCGAHTMHAGKGTSIRVIQQRCADGPEAL